MNNTFIFDTPNGVIREKPSMAKPEPVNIEHYSVGGVLECVSSYECDLYHYQCNVDIYNDHIDSLRSYPYDPSLLECFGAGKELIEGKDFEARLTCISGEWEDDCGYGKCDKCVVMACQTMEYVREQLRSREPKPERVFTLQDMIECWEACSILPGTADKNLYKKKYMKTLYNIDLP